MATSLENNETKNLLIAMGYDPIDISAAMTLLTNIDDMNYLIDEIEKQQQITSLPPTPILEISSVAPTSITFTSYGTQSSFVLECKYKLCTDSVWSTNTLELEPCSDECTINNLKECTKYILQFCARNKMGWTKWSDAMHFSTPESPLVITLLNPKEYTGKRRETDTDDNVSETLNVTATDSYSFDVSALKIGDKCDGEDDYSVWYESEVVDIDPEQGIKLSFLNWSSKFNEWLSFTQHERFSNLNEKTLKFEQLTVPHLSVLSEPKHYVSKIDGRDYMIMICNDAGIVRYDIQEDRYELLYADATLTLSNIENSFICTSMDTLHNILYVIWSVNDIREFDVDHKRWIHAYVDESTTGSDDNDTKDTNDRTLSAVFVGKYTYMNTLCLQQFDAKEIHYKYYGNKQCDAVCIDMDDLYPELKSGWRCMNACMMYCEYVDQIIVIKQLYDELNRHFHHYLGYLQLNDGYTWRQIDIDMKMNCGKNYVLAFGHLLFIFDHCLPQCIYCWDLMTNVYYECDKRFPKTRRKTTGKLNRFEFQTVYNGYVFLFDPTNGHHIKIDLFDLIPKQLYEQSCYSKRNQLLLVSGYLREIEELQYLIPSEIVKIISVFHPIFL